MHCEHPDCWNILTQEDIDKGFDHCSEECFHTDMRPVSNRRNPYDSLFDDPYAEDIVEEE